nr:glycosyltransferase family 2 protein [Bacteroides intestinalis]
MICILLSTYNGANFIDEQIDSLTKQVDAQFSILVRDDGSLDSTPLYLKRWEEKNIIKWYQGQNVGFVNSFFDLLMKAPEADYYAFCDQDDIWLPDKLKVAVSKIETLNTNLKLYCSNLYIYRNGTIRGKMQNNYPKFNLGRGLVQNIATGCTILINNEFRSFLIHNMPNKVCAHDLWIYHTALLFGSVYYDDGAYILYRQHGNNQIGTNSSFFDALKRKAKSLSTLWKQHYRELEANELLRCYSPYLTSSQIECLKDVALYRYSINRRMKFLFSRKYVMNNVFDNFFLKLRIILGKV